MHVCTAHLEFPQTDSKLVQNLCRTARKLRGKAGWKPIYLFFFLPQDLLFAHCARGAQHGYMIWHSDNKDTAVTMGKIPTDPNAGCYLGWITRMWRTTPRVGQRTLFPLVHVFAGLPMLIPSPERFLRINLQLLMELVACFGTSIWILLMKFASIPMKTVRLGIVFIYSNLIFKQLICYSRCFVKITTRNDKNFCL